MPGPWRSCAADVGRPLPVIIDTDPGIDDALALAFALRTSELAVQAVTVTYGNCYLGDAYRNALHLIQRFARQPVPCYAGARAPLVRPLQPAVDTHGPFGTGYAPPPPLARPQADWAPTALLDLLRSAETPVTLITLGPLTNLALALAIDEALVRRRVKELVVMAGAALVPGNVTPRAEFNVWADPEAARRVLAARLPVRLVGLDVTRQVVLPATAVAELASLDHPDAAWWAAMLRCYVDFHRQAEELDGCVLNDVLAVALAVDPHLGHGLPMSVGVCCDWGAGRGATICRPATAAADGTALVYLEVDARAALQRCFRAVLGVELPL